MFFIVQNMLNILQPFSQNSMQGKRCQIHKDDGYDTIVHKWLAKVIQYSYKYLPCHAWNIKGQNGQARLCLTHEPSKIFHCTLPSPCTSKLELILQTKLKVNALIDKSWVSTFPTSTFQNPRYNRILRNKWIVIFI